MQKSRLRLGKGVVVGKNVQFGKEVVVWNYVVICDDVKIGDRTRVGSFCDIGRGASIGSNCNIQSHVTISNECNIGNNVFIGPNTTFLNDKFPCSRPLVPPRVKDGVIIGGGVIILPDVTIHENSVIAAGSIVTKDVQPEVVVRGFPAKPVMTRREYEAKRRAFMKRNT